MEPFLLGKKYYVRFSFLGEQYKISLKTTNKKIADRIAEQIQIGLERGTFDSFDQGMDGDRILKLLIARPGLKLEEAVEELVATAKRKLLREGIDEYLENCRTEHSPSNHKNEVRIFSYFYDACKVNFVNQVTPEIIEKYRNQRVEAVGKSTVNREIKMLKRFFKQAVQKGYTRKSPAEDLKTYREPDHAIRHLSDDEVKKILAAAPPDLQRILICFLLTGIRYGELCHLEWSDIDFRHRQILVQPKENWRPKNFKKRVIPMHSAVETILSEMPRKEDVSLVFPDDEGKCADGGLRNRLYRVFANAKVSCNVKDLRSTFASNAVMSGMPIYTVSKLLGHHDVKITEKHYAHLAPDYMGNAITMLRPQWGNTNGLLCLSKRDILATKG